MARRLPQFLRPAEAEQLLAQTRSERERLAIATMLYLGLRISETCALRVEDLDLDDLQLLIRRGKGGKDAYVRLPRALVPWIRSYLTSKALRRGWLFPSPGQGLTHMHRRWLEYLVPNLAGAAGIQRRITPHHLRHTYAVSLLQAGVPLTEVSHMMRHSQLETTTIYLHVVTDHLQVYADRLPIPTGQGRLWAVR